jgi:serine/threonine protein kinase
MDSIILPDQQKIQLLRKIGEGSFGKVYQIVYNNKPSALKIVDRLKIKDIQLMKTEIDIINMINEKYPNCGSKYLLCFNKVLEDENYIYFISELMDMDLFDFVQSDTYNLLDLCQKIDLVYELSLEMIEGLDVLHKLGIIHRDIKLENFLIGKDEKDQYILKIADFGLSCFIEQCNKTRAGTLAYITPKNLYRLRFNMNLDWRPRSDLYALATVIYEALIMDTYIDPDVLNDQLRKPNLSYENFESFINDTFDDKMKYFNLMKSDTDKFCPSESAEKLEKLMRFIIIFLDPKEKNSSDLNTQFAKKVLTKF